MTKLKTIRELEREFPPATAQEARRAGRRDDDAPLQLYLPKTLLKALKERALARDTTVRSVVLEALVGAGFKVSAGELGDRRR